MELIESGVEGLFANWTNSIIQDSLKMIDTVIFNYEGLGGYALEFYNLLVWFSGGLMVCLALGKIILQLITEAEGSQEANIFWTIIQAIKGSVLVFIMPFIVSLVMNQIVMPLGSYIMGNIGEISTEYMNSMMDLENGPLVNFFSGAISIIVFGLFVAVVIVVFIVKFIMSQANIMMNEILTPLVGVSVMTENFNFVDTWWKDLLQHSVTLIVLALSLLLFTESIFSFDGTSGQQFISVIGSGVLVITGPTLVKNIWYHSGLSRAGSSAARMVMSKVIR